MSTGVIDGALAYLGAHIIWKSAGTITGSSTQLSLADIDYNELAIEVLINSGNNRTIFYVPAAMLATNTVIYFRQGGYGGSSSAAMYVVVGVAKNYATLNQASLFQTDYTSNSIMRVWYR